MMEHGRLFLGGISWNTNEDGLREYFQNFGEVTEVVLLKDRATGRGRGFGFVVFADPAVAERVVLEKHLIDGRHVEAKKAVPRTDQNIQNILSRSGNTMIGSPGPARTKKIFVGGLPSTITELDFKKYFDQFGVITDVVVMYDHNTQRPRGFGFITFDSEEAVDKVLYKTFHELNGKMVEVKHAVPKELSPGPSRSQLGTPSPGRASSFLNNYYQGYSPNSVGALGARMDHRFNPVAAGTGALPPFSSSYGSGFTGEAGLFPSNGGNTSIDFNLGYGRVLNSFYNGPFNRYSSSIGHSWESGESTILTATGQNLWRNTLNYSANTANSSAFTGSGTISGSTLNSNHAGGFSSHFSSESHGVSQGDLSCASDTERFQRNSGTILPPAPSYSAANDVYGRNSRDNYGENSSYGDRTWLSLLSELEVSSSLNYGFLNATSDVAPRNFVGYVGSGVAHRQTSGGIAA